jgi:UDP-glucose 4-epimerase
MKGRKVIIPKKKILVTGGAGFIGSHVVNKLIEEGHEVIIIDDLSTGRQLNINPNAKFYHLDIQSPKLEAVFKKERPSYVSHHAAQIDVRRSVSDPVFDAGVNILGTINILQNCVNFKVKRIIFASSGGAIYGEQTMFPAAEDHPLNPVSPYGISKLVAEYYLHYYKVMYGMDYVSLRYANVYGPRQDPYGETGVVAIFIQKMLAGEQPIINGNGKQTRDFIYVGDVAEANVLALQHNLEGNIFNIGTGVETSVEQLFNGLKKIINPLINKRYGPSKQGEQIRSVIDYAKAKKILHWEPKTPLSYGLSNTCKYFSDLYVNLT